MSDLHRLLRRFLGHLKPGMVAGDPESTRPASEMDELLYRYEQEALADPQPRTQYETSQYTCGREIMSLADEKKAELASLAASRWKQSVRKLQAGTIVLFGSGEFRHERLLKWLLFDLLRLKLPFLEAHVCELLDALLETKYVESTPASGFVRAAEVYVASNGLTNAVSRAINRLISQWEGVYIGAAGRKLVNRLKMLRDGRTVDINVPLTRSETWSAAMLDFLDAQNPELRVAWSCLLNHAATAASSKPTKVWLKAARTSLDQIGAENFARQLVDWISLVEKGGRNQRPVGIMNGQKDEHLIMDAPNAQILKGLVWCATLVADDERIVQALGRLGTSCYRKIPWFGARSTGVANACVWALGAIPGKEAVGQLSMLRSKSKYHAAKHGIAKALTAAAEREGISPEDLEELAAPTFKLTEVGKRIEQLGEHRAELSIVDSHTVDLKWLSPSGKAQKSIPVTVKRDFADAVKELKATQKSILGALPALRSRFENVYLREKRWSLAAWRERYLDHPVVGTLARRLIWKFVTKNGARCGAWHDGRIVDSANLPIEMDAADCQVELWHPAGAATEEVVAWRNWLERHAVKQPFKQAHREIYILTDAERNTETYSNRFAAHILRQHQFAALCRERGWRYSLQGAFDSANNAVVDLPHWNLRTEYWSEPVANEQSPTGIFLYLSTDQVRFYRAGEREPMRVVDVPPLVFSEIMRDVDLFVGVCSVGNDPNWADGGPNGRYFDYWQSHAFGDLSDSAKTRREVLGRLIPKLAIAGRCSVDDKFLHVRGDIRSYKIHLGSGNILMTPNDRYLCIVPDRGSSSNHIGKLYLPFEGDGMLSIIVSKAILLAGDRKITDPTITRQITSN